MRAYMDETRVDVQVPQDVADQTGSLISMQTVRLHFHGPLEFTSGERSLFHSPLHETSCVYLWTVRSGVDERYYIHYIGEAQSFSRRQREHLIHVLGLDYGIFDPADARRGVATRLWDGLWRDRSPEGPSRALEQYARGAASVVEYVSAIAVFVAPLEGGRGLRRRIEGAIGRNLRIVHPEAKTLYPDDNRIGTGSTDPMIRLEVTADAPIAGLDSVLEV